MALFPTMEEQRCSLYGSCGGDITQVTEGMVSKRRHHMLPSCLPSTLFSLQLSSTLPWISSPTELHPSFPLFQGTQVRAARDICPPLPLLPSQWSPGKRRSSQSHLILELARHFCVSNLFPLPAPHCKNQIVLYLLQTDRLQKGSESRSHLPAPGPVVLHINSTVKARICLRLFLVCLSPQDPWFFSFLGVCLSSLPVHSSAFDSLQSSPFPLKGPNRPLPQEPLFQIYWVLAVSSLVFTVSFRPVSPLQACLSSLLSSP